MLVTRFVAVSLAAWFAVALAPAQMPGEFDFDISQLTVSVIPPNGSTHVISAPVTYTGQNLRLNAPLRITAAGELRLLRSQLEVVGSVTLEDGGRLTVIDSDLLLRQTFSQQYDLRVEGGLVHTERARIGSSYVGTSVFLTRMLHLRGTWLARHTVCQCLALIIADGRNGWFGNPLHKGGSLFGLGVYEGDRADALHMTGMGDVHLTNGTMNIALYLDAAGSPVPTTTTIDLDRRVPLTRTYGDPLIHAGVTNAIANNPYWLSLNNHRSSLWQLFAVNANSALPLQTVHLQNAEDVICNFRGTNFTGSPILAGPWASHYATLPGLPSTAKPGYHALPPACSVQLANVKYESGPNPGDWNSIRSWGIYASGTGTNLTVSGPSLIAELQLTNGTMNLSGTGSFDMGVRANTCRLYQGANLTITNAAIGDFQNTSLIGLVEANNQGVCTITNSRMANVRFRTTNASAAISATNLFGAENVIVDTAGGGVVTITQATPTQSWDRQNLGFESSPLLAGNTPPYWAATSVTGSAVATAAPGAPGTTSYEFQATANGASLEKQLTLPPETSLTMIGAARILTPPGSGGIVASMSHGAATPSAALNLGIVNAWQRFQVPLLTTTAAGTAALRLQATGTPAVVQLDDFRVVLGSWWDQDNLANLDFEGQCRDRGFAPDYWRAPDGWTAFQLRSEPDPTVTRPGANPGSQSLRVVPTHPSANIGKVLTFFRAGESVRVRGWVLGTSTAGANIQVIVGNGPNYFVVAPPNVFSGPIACNGTWQFVDVTYVVPVNPIYTRVGVSVFGMTNIPVWFDDFTVEVQ